MNISAQKIPEAVRNFAKSKLAMISDDDFIQVEELNDGRSGAIVYRVEIKSKRSRLSGYYIIKCVDTTGPWFQKERNEATRYALLINNCQQFKDKLVTLFCYDHVGTLLVIIYSQAVSSVTHAVPLENLSGNALIKYISMLSSDLLTKLNATCTEEKGGRSFFEHTLSYRLAPGGNFITKAQGLLKDSNCPAIVLYGEVYPNPIYYILQSAQNWIGALDGFIFRKGNVHGDLHGKNVICWQEEGIASDRYSVIDYDSYQEDGYLLFDNAYLELYFYLFFRNEDNDCRQWIEKIAPLIAHSPFIAAEEEPGTIFPSIRNAICKGITQWADATFPQNKDDIEIQYRLARIAAGINFFSKGGIQEEAILTKLLLYISMNLKLLFRSIKREWNDSPTTQIIAAQVRDDVIDVLWSKVVRHILNASYIPILITDDAYIPDAYDRLSEIYRLPWAAVFEIGANMPPNDLSTHHPNTFGKKDVRTLDLHSDAALLEYTKGVCDWVTAKENFSSEVGYANLWRIYGDKIRKLMEKIQSVSSMQPMIFIFDISAKALKFKQYFMGFVLANLVTNSRFVFLRDCGLAEDDQASLREGMCDYTEVQSATLEEVAEAVHIYLPATSHRHNVVLPSIQSITPEALTEKELARYGTSVELVYAGMEDNENVEEDFGEGFFHGNEIRWYDLAHEYDLPLIRNYDAKREELLNSINESGHRIKEMLLIHGAGTGGTTLSKRLLWDLRNDVPCMRLLKYTKDTVNILMEIYAKTRKRLLLVVETGSTIITNDQLIELKASIKANNGRLMILRVERGNANDDPPAGTLIQLQDTLPQTLAVQFCKTFMPKATYNYRKTNLQKLTYASSSEWVRQRCAFFYGFYTYMEDYNMSAMIQSTIEECTEEEKGLLSDMALITIYSQNISIQRTELRLRMSEQFTNINLSLVCQYLKSSVAKLIVEHNTRNGLRICHPFVAKRLLECIWQKGDYRECVFSAACQYIDRMFHYYGDGEEIDLIYKELFIERAIVDSERMKFSQLIEDIKLMSEKEFLFRKLIEYYPNNAHYYNHIARLLVEKQEQCDYNQALDIIQQAISISEHNGDKDISMHYITMGCILAKRIHSVLAEEEQMLKTGRGIVNILSAIERIRSDYILADGAFTTAREKAHVLDSYCYFPCIRMECFIIQGLQRCDQDRRSMAQLIDQHSSFAEWYTEHFNKMCLLLDEMKVSCKEYEAEMVKKAQDRVELLKIEDKRYFIQKLQGLIKKEDKNAPSSRRAFSNLLYVENNFSWNGINQAELAIVIQAYEKNILVAAQDGYQGDIVPWFEAYRYSKDFNAIQAIRYITDYMKDGFRKEYILFWLDFLLLEQRHSVRRNYDEHLIKCKNMIPARYSTVAWHDAYTENVGTACPIISRNEVSRRSHGAISNLRDFYGTIKQIHGNSSGLIILDELALEVVFNPVYRNEFDNSYQFSMNDEGKRVVFNLVFTFSGPRAWNLRPLSSQP